jgi:hypothetical protein
MQHRGWSSRPGSPALALRWSLKRGGVFPGSDAHSTLYLGLTSGIARCLSQ